MVKRNAKVLRELSHPLAFVQVFKRRHVERCCGVEKNVIEKGIIIHILPKHLVSSPVRVYRFYRTNYNYCFCPERTRSYEHVKRKWTIQVLPRYV